ncbi:hypothetical protein DPMN_165306 [Dreissena polymorpha]|uniref:Uncharacterized protein n=1 Tax=Dreissena polymorpha TaxID=45954 RepID=A0A9D4EWL3_DREPO|nr:hypothetical protein DPMN_165306 [Dreissena polymorpha]
MSFFENLTLQKRKLKKILLQKRELQKILLQKDLLQKVFVGLQGMMKASRRLTPKILLPKCKLPGDLNGLQAILQAPRKHYKSITRDSASFQEIGLQGILKAPIPKRPLPKGLLSGLLPRLEEN